MVVFKHFTSRELYKFIWAFRLVKWRFLFILWISENSRFLFFSLITCKQKFHTVFVGFMIRALCSYIDYILSVDIYSVYPSGHVLLVWAVYAAEDSLYSISDLLRSSFFGSTLRIILLFSFAPETIFHIHFGQLILNIGVS